MIDPDFLLSSERSGSNLFRVIIDSHPEYSAPHSPHLIKTFVPLLPKYGDLTEPDRLRQLAEDLRHIVEIQLRDWPFVPTADAIVEHAQEYSFRGLLNSIYSLAAQNNGKSKSFVKDNGAIPLAAEVATIFPNSKFVYLVRDARDVALSWKKSPGHPGGVKDAAQMWRKEQNEAIYFLSVLNNCDRIKIVHYEDLIARQEDEIRDVCEFLNVEFNKQMLQFHKGKEAKTSADAAVGWNNLVKPILSNNSARYKKELSRREQRKIESIACSPMQQLGYQLDHKRSTPILEPDFFGKLIRAGRVAVKQLFRGREGIRELKMRTKRLSGMRNIINRVQNEQPVWSKPNSNSPDANSTSSSESS